MADQKEMSWKDIADTLKSPVAEIIESCFAEMKNIPEFSEAEEWVEIEERFQELNYILGAIAFGALPPLLEGLDFLETHLETIAPLLLGLGTTLLTLRIAKWVQALGEAKDKITSFIKLGRGVKRGDADSIEKARQTYGGMMGNPLVWKAMGMLNVVGIIYGIASAIAEMTGVAESGFGVICGAVNVALQFLKNLGLWLINGIVAVSAVLSAIIQDGMNLADSVGLWVHSFFSDLAGWFLEGIVSIVEWLNKIPGIDIDTSGISNLAEQKRANAESYRQEAKAMTVEAQSYSDIFSDTFNGCFQTFEDGWMEAAWQSGSEWGDAAAAKVSDTIAGFTQGETIAEDTGYSASPYSDSEELSCRLDEESRGYLQMTAEKEPEIVEVRPEVTVNVSNVMNVSKEVDEEALFARFVAMIGEAMNTQANGMVLVR